jgi:hypothetical protein
MGAALAYTYRYPYSSNLAAEGTGFGLRLAASGTRGNAESSPHFFRGKLGYPKEVADQLLVLMDLVGSRFYLPLSPKALDPVVTSNEAMLRFEGFSSCCGVYGRVDLDGDAFDAEQMARGTTNVDFNGAMRTSLARIRNDDAVTLSVGAEGVTLESAGKEVVEKKVKLPVRWLKGFSEVQAYQAPLKMKLEVGASEARQFVRSLPRGGHAKQASWVVPMGRGLRLSQRESKEGVRVIGTDRLRLLEGLVGGCMGLRIWSEESGTSLWEVLYESGRFSMMVSPEVSRGFSGEGQMLEKLARRGWETALPRVQAELSWQAKVDVNTIVAKSGLDREAVESALAVLGARGLVGYDATMGAYFHRELPFDLDAVEALQPRLKDARALVAEDGVRILERKGEGESLEAIVMVRGTDVEHRVKLTPDRDVCTCPWFSKNQGERGVCKHVLAARIAVDGDA